MSFTVEDGFTYLGKNVGIVKGVMGEEDLINLKRWLWNLKQRTIDDAVLLIDSQGGRACPEVLMAEIQVPLHTHVLDNAHSFAALLSLAGSYVTVQSIDSMYMFHGPRSANPEDDNMENSILYEYVYRFGSIMGSVLPAGDLKKAIGEALTGTEDVIVNTEWMWHHMAIDNIGAIKAEDLRLEGKVKEWYEREYIYV